MVGAACSEDGGSSPTSPADKRYEICFSTTTTKAGVVEDQLEDEAAAEDRTFTVEGWVHDEGYDRLMRTNVSYDNNMWSPTNTIYWPMGSGARVDFFAWRGMEGRESDVTISPNNEKIEFVYSKRATRIGTDAAGNKLPHTLPTMLYKSAAGETIGKVYASAASTSHDMEAASSDVMYAKTLNVMNPTDQALAGLTSINTSVDLSFNHILTLLRFKFISEKSASGDYLRADIKAMTLHNIKSSRTFASRHTVGSQVIEDKWYVSFDEDGNAIQYNSRPNFLCVPTKWSGESVPDAADNTTVEVGSECKNGILVIPQEIKEWDPKSATIEQNDAVNGGVYGTYLRVYCDIYHVVGGSETHTFGDQKDISADAEVTLPDDYCIYIPITSTGLDGINDRWQSGNNVTYEIILGAGYDANGKALKSRMWGL